MPSLKTINIGRENMRNVRNFTINGFESLETLSVGSSSFWLNSGARNDGECIISNCPELISITFDESAFREYEIFRLQNLTNLQSVTLNGANFKYSSIFDIESRRSK